MDSFFLKLKKVPPGFSTGSPVIDVLFPHKKVRKMQSNFISFRKKLAIIKKF